MKPNIPEEFNEIRPYSHEELPQAIEELIADDRFRAVIAGSLPNQSFDDICQVLRSARTSLEVQKLLVAPIIQESIVSFTAGTDLDASSLPDKTISHTFVSNHRDIVMDSAFLSKLMLDNGFPTTVEIAIGDNLLIYPWIKTLVRINKAFIVQRSVGIRQALETSARMSRYMHYAISEKQENIWIAQRQGRSKDSNDHTDPALLKMMAMGGEGTHVERLKALRITPLSISYEYDPCDFLKAQEFQQKRDNPNFKKTQEDDLRNMQVGIFGQKGCVHYQMAYCINDELDEIAELPKGEFFPRAASIIDSHIFRGYRIYPGNYVAADLLRHDTSFASCYTADDKAKFEAYLSSRLSKINLPDRDEDYLRCKILEMYANPLFNHQSVQ